jgi:hypothetical protein
MPLTQLRRRRADAYRVQIPPAATAVEVLAAQQAAWDAAGERVVYQRSIGQWTYRGELEGPDYEVVDPGHRRYELAQVPGAALPFSDPLQGLTVREILRVTDPPGATFATGEPVATVDALAVDPVTGDVAVYWHRADEWPFEGPALQHLDRISAAGVHLGGQVIQLSAGILPFPCRAPITCTWGLGLLWAIEPQPTPAAPDDFIDFALPARIVRRAGSALGISGSRDLEEGEAVGWPGGDSICPDLSGVDGAWAIITRRWLEGTGPWPTFAAPNVYDVSYILPLTNGLAGAEALLSFGHGATAPWSMDEIASFGRSTILDSLAAGVPRFVSIGQDPDGWPEGDADGNIWRWRYEASAETRETGTGRSSAAYTGGWYGRSLHRLAAGSYLVHPGADASVDDLTLEALP